MNKRTSLTILVLLAMTVAPLLEAATIIPQGTLIKIRLEQTLSTKTSRTGEMVKFTAAEELEIGKRVVVRKGAFVQAQLEKVRGPGRFGKNGSLKIKYLFVKAANGKQVPITLGERAAKTNESMGYAAGASAAGFMILGPVGILGGAFVKGKHITIPAGTELLVEIARDTAY